MKTKIYSLLYFQQLCDKYSKWIFPLHEGENIIGSDKDVDIFLYLNKKEGNIESVHCKIIVDENKKNIGIISLTDKGFVKINDKDKKIILLPGKVYDLINKSVFYLTDNLKFMLIKGTLDEINTYFIEQRLENEYQKWYQLILNQKNNIKINLNLQRKDSLNNTIISNKSFNNNNNILKSSNTKEINRIGFNNFDEVLDDNLLNDNNNNNLYISPIKKDKINTFLEINKNGNERNNSKNKKNNENNTNINNEEMKIENENIINNENSIIKENNNEINKNDNNMILYKKSSFENKNNSNNKYDEKIINKNEKTIRMIKELLGENNLDIIIKNTNFKKIKKYDIYLKNNKSKIDKGKFVIKFDKKNYIEINKKSNKK